MHVVISFFLAAGLPGLLAAVPQPGVGGHLWHPRNVSNNTLPTGSGKPVATEVSVQGAPSSTVVPAAGNSSALVSVASATSVASLPVEKSTNASGTSTDFQAASHCGMWDSVQTGDYSIQNLLWGEGMATSGSQCFGVDSLIGNTVAWHSVWTWAGNPYNVKSYSNANLNFSPKQLSDINSIPSKWSYTQTGSSFTADVSYDMFLADSIANAANVAYVADARTYEIMVWLAAVGIEPTSSLGSGALTTTTIGGTNWKLYKGPSGSTTVFSFVADPEITDFSGDLYDFYKYLMTSQGVSGNQYLAYIGAGTEAFVGSNVQLEVTGYSCSVV